MDHRRAVKRFAITIACCYASVAFAREIWVVVGVVRGPVNGCAPVYTWVADANLHNIGTDAASLRPLEISNGGGALSGEILIAPHKSASVGHALGQQGPSFSQNGIVAVKIEAADALAAEGRLEYWYEFPCELLPPIPGPVGKGVFPIFTRLAAAGVKQHHFGTDLAYQPYRLNVGVYNDGLAAAVATIEVERPGCNGAVTRQTMLIPPKSLLQGGVPVPPTCIPADRLAPPWIANTTVIVDQPSFSYVSVVSNAGPPASLFTVGSMGQ